jgi:hypothetical protein
MHHLQPTVWQWYLQRDTGLKFEVIDVDHDQRLIEIQDEIGDLIEIDFDNWFQAPLEQTEEPQDFLVLLDKALDADDADESIHDDSIHQPPLHATQDEIATTYSHRTRQTAASM